MQPLIIGHRGAPGYRPEHTLASYQLAIRLGADVIEPDLVITADGHLVARHEPEISGTTDVAEHPELAGRRTTKLVDGVEVTGWFVEDLTLRELRTLRAVERIPALRPANRRHDRRHPVPTFAEILDLVRWASRRTGRRIGVAPETKHPTYFREQGRPLEPPLVRALVRARLDRPGAGVYVQSFEVSTLVALRSVLDVELVQLTAPTGAPYDLAAAGDPRTHADLAGPAGLRAVARYAGLLGPDKAQVTPELVADAHRAGLRVVPYTFRNENAFLPADLRVGPDPAAYGDAAAEYARFFRLGVDGVFSDHPDTAVRARAAVAARPAARATG